MNVKDQLFASLLHLFYQSGMQGLGKIPNPINQSFETDTHQATESIQILEILKEKTQGNLTPELAQILDQYLQTLQQQLSEV